MKQRARSGPPVFEGVDSDWRPCRRPTDRQLWTLIAFFWGTEFLLATMRSYVDHSAKLQIYTLLRTVTALFGSAECYLLHLLVQRRSEQPIWRRSGIFLVAAGLAGALNLYFGNFLQGFTSFKVSDYGLGWKIFNLSYWILLFVAWASIYLVLLYSGDARDQERRSRHLERVAHDAQLRALRFQVDPHFLFNSLNSLSALIRSGSPAEADVMLNRISDFFRTTLEANPHEDISLAEEMALQKIYLEIEQTRFPDMTVEIDIPPSLRSARLPCLLLQPLVENAVKYSVATRPGPSRIRVSAHEVCDGLLELRVRDDGAGLPSKPGTGTGLQNVSERLKARFGDEASLSAAPAHPTGWAVTIHIPLVR
jgi:two-component system LytT family sensor kinase